MPAPGESAIYSRRNSDTLAPEIKELGPRASGKRTKSGCLSEYSVIYENASVYFD